MAAWLAISRVCYFRVPRSGDRGHCPAVRRRPGPLALSLRTFSSAVLHGAPRRVVWKVRKALLGLRTSPRRWQEHPSSKLKEHVYIQDERALCLFANAELNICIGVHVGDMLAVGPNEFTKNLLQELAKDMALRWSTVTDNPEEFRCRALCRTPQGYKFVVSCDCVTQLCKDVGFDELKGSNTLSFEKITDNDTILDESGQRRHSQSLARLLWLDRPDIKKRSLSIAPLTSAQLPLVMKLNIKRLLRYLIGNPACNTIVGCNLDVPEIAGTPQGGRLAGPQWCQCWRLCFVFCDLCVASLRW